MFGLKAVSTNYINANNIDIEKSNVLGIRRKLNISIFMKKEINSQKTIEDLLGLSIIQPIKS